MYGTRQLLLLDIIAPTSASTDDRERVCSRRILSGEPCAISA
jgi:hypothetical protein